MLPVRRPFVPPSHLPPHKHRSTWPSRAAAFFLAGLSLQATRGANVVTQHNDNNRTGLNGAETILRPSNVTPAGFGKLFEKPVDGDLYSQPLYVQRVRVNGGVHNVVYVSTANNTVYAFDADDGAVPAYWSATLGPAIPQKAVQSVSDIAHVIGIISTGVIDVPAGAWYVITQERNLDDKTFHQKLHALDLSTGKEKFGGPQEISANTAGVHFDPKLNNQRASLLLQGGNVYAAWSSHNDGGDYHGWVMAFNARTLAQVAAWPATTTSGGKGGIWMSGGGVTGDGRDVYVTVGNGRFNANTGGKDVSQSFVRLNSVLERQDYFTPADWDKLNGPDTDVGAQGVLLIPGTDRLLSGGKNGKWYLVAGHGMGGYKADSDACVQSFMVTNVHEQLHHLHGAPCFWNNLVFVGGESDPIKAYHWDGITLDTKPAGQTTFGALSDSMPGWQLSISANGARDAIVWATRPNSGNANNATQPGILHAFDAADLSHELWNSQQNAPRDDFGNFAKNPSVTIANGKVYCPTFSNKLVVYGLLAP